MTRVRARSSALCALCAILSCLILLPAQASATPAAALLPRGVRPSRARNYLEALKSSSGSAASFRCLDGSGDPLPASRINDDYCDCVDGSDEPGEAGRESRSGGVGSEGKREKERERERGNSILMAIDRRSTLTTNLSLHAPPPF